MSPSPSELESATYWLSWLEAGSTIALFLVALGVGYEFVANRLEKPLRKTVAAAQAAELEQLRKETAEAQKEAAQAQLALKQVDAKAGQRFLNVPKFRELLKNKPRGTVRLLYKPNDSEAYLFALQIWRNLGPGVNGDGAGWNVSDPEPIPESRGDTHISATAPLDVRYGASTGLAIWSKEPPGSFTDNSAINALRNALSEGVDRNGTMIILSDPLLPEDHFVVVVGQKM